MKTVQQKTGALGENYAASYLKKKGYRILERNWRRRRAEIDIIAMDGEIMVFVEVKTRMYTGLRRPEEAVTRAKLEAMVRAAGAYMVVAGHDWEVRFDIVGVTLLPEDEHTIDHYRDVYFPGR